MGPHPGPVSESRPLSCLPQPPPAPGGPLEIVKIKIQDSTTYYV